MSMTIGPFTAGMVATDNLVFYIDSANNDSSFDDVGFIWSDMTANAVDADVSTISYANPDANFDGTTTIASFDTGPIGKLADIFESGATLSAWIRVESDGEGNLGRIIDKASWNFLVENESGGNVDLAFGTVQATNPGKWVTDTGAEIAINTWVHVAVSFISTPVDSTDPTIYIDGVSKTITEDGTPSGANVSDADNPIIVGNESGVSRTFDGDINVVKVWNKILSQAEITAEYNALKDRFQ